MDFLRGVLKRLRLACEVASSAGEGQRLTSLWQFHQPALHQDDGALHCVSDCQQSGALALTGTDPFAHRPRPAGGPAGAAEADPRHLAFCAAVVAGLPYKRGDEPCIVVQVRGGCRLAD